MWNNELAIGIKEWDEQHQELFRRLDALLAACCSGNCTVAVQQTIVFLEEYIGLHFATEEQQMALHEPPQFRQHLAEHARFIIQLDSIKKSVAAGVASSEIALQVNQMLIDWLKNHILQTDKVSASYLLAYRPES